MKFGFDIDDTLINLREHAFHIYNDKLAQSVDLQVFHALTTMEINEAFGLTKEEGSKLWSSLRDEIYYTECPPFPHAIDVLQELVHQGHEVYYITARAKEHTERTRDWLITSGFPVAEGHFYCGMNDSEKVHIIKDLQLDYYFDDKPAVLETLSELAINVYVKDRSYNQHIHLPRIVSWNELRETLKS
ncbi:5' nucleotidase, NT5C type [Paenibacillus sp. N3.4]|uniref:5' nucleotidase, NT5C type n=1 Tax=Paenibacillus sp. N3.4 TaxID=2603222 RepID=UPI0011C6F76C|nr:HAD hydrolase-like protein [Paenibacillus sp. N3.4]TXK84786.1 HAD hydrolase-like protein [Paenibacillus sp. N3.4]